MAIINGIFTVVLLVLFIGIWVWAWSSRNKDNFDRMAALPLEDEQVNNLEVKHD